MKKIEITIDYCKDMIKDAETISNFKKFYKHLYDTCVENDWLGEVCEGIPNTRPVGYWSIERATTEAKKYSTRTSFQKNAGQAYRVIRKNKLLDEACSHMVYKEGCSYLRYRYAIEFPSVKKVYVGITFNLTKRKSSHFRLKNGKSDHNNKNIRELINAGVEYVWNPREESFHINDAKNMEQELYDEYKANGWEMLNIAKLGSIGMTYSKNKHECHLDALKYMTRNEFQKKSNSSYDVARRHGWLDEICSHMIRLSKPYGYWDDYDRCFESASKCKSRTEFRKKYSCAYSTCIKNGWLDEVCIHMGRKHKANGYWSNYENCRTEALKCNSRTEFKEKYPVGYRYSSKNGWLDDVCSHMIIVREKSVWDDFEKCKEEALKYNTRTEFCRGSQTAYTYSLNNKWLNDVCSHMVGRGNVKGFWQNFEKCKEEALKYETRNEFRKKSSSAYNSSRKNGWLDDICSHMKQLVKCRGFWSDYNTCKDEASKYDTRSEFEDKCSGGYESSRKNKWLNDFFPNTKVTKPFGHWLDYQNCKSEASKYKSRSEFEKNCGAGYKSSREHKWLDEFYPNTKVTKVDGFWQNYQNCEAEALKYQTRGEFRNKSQSAYNSSHKNKWIDDICSHMSSAYKEWSYDTCKTESSKYKNRSEFNKKSSTAYNLSLKNKWLDDFFPKK